jgi:hypothetical protein
MTFEEFQATLKAAAPPAELSDLLRALWLDKQGDFDAAHAIAQEVAGPDGARVHAYLHREEGDESNARYWYRRAGAPVVSGSLSAEWEALVLHLLG